MYICSVVARTYGREKAWEPLCIYICMHQQKRWLCMHAWVHVYLCSSSTYIWKWKGLGTIMYLYLHASTKALVRVSRCWCFWAVKDVCYRALCTHHLAQPREQSEIQPAFKGIHSKDADGRAFLLLLLDFIVKCICLWVLGHARDAGANARHEKKPTGHIISMGWTAWKPL